MLKNSVLCAALVLLASQASADVFSEMESDMVQCRTHAERQRRLEDRTPTDRSGDKAYLDRFRACALENVSARAAYDRRKISAAWDALLAMRQARGAGKTGAAGQ